MNKDLSILLIEDNEGDQLILKETLSEEEDIIFHISTAETLEQGKNKYVKGQFDVILLDLGLPDAAGLQALEVIVREAHDTPVIVITGLNDDDIGRKAVQMGAQNYLVKGILDSKLVTTSILHSIERFDILKRLRKSESELEAKNKELDNLNNSKDRLLSVLSHDLKGLVLSSVSYMDLVLSDFDEFSNEEVREMVTTCFNSMKVTGELLENLLSWARLQSKNYKIVPAYFEIRPFYDEVIEPIILSAENKKITVEKKVEKDLKVYADRKMIATVIRNLVSNSIKFTHPYGKIIIEAEKRDDNKVCLSVEDNGVGISKENMKKIFDVGEGFTTAGTENEQGTGLGLILCKDFVESNNGHFSIQSEPDKGSRMEIVLPASSEK